MAAILKERMVIRVLPMAIRILVRRPASLCDSSRSSPMIPPSMAASRIFKMMSISMASPQPEGNDKNNQQKQGIKGEIGIFQQFFRFFGRVAVLG